MTVLGWFLAVLAALLLFLLIPVRVLVTLDPEPKLTLRYLLLRLPLLPDERKEKPAGKAKKEPEKQSKKEKKKLTAADIRETAALLLELLPRCIAPVRRLLRRTTLADLSLTLPATGEDASAVAVSYGRMNAAVYNGIALLDRLFTLKVRRVEIVPCFAGESLALYFHLEIRLVPLAALAAAFDLGLQAVIVLFRSLRRQGSAVPQKEAAISKKGEASNGKQPSHQ